jgi:CheY-like chemotaxis protein
MPVMDGPTFAHVYHEMPGPHAPIVVITATSDSKDLASSMGAAECLSKPVDTDQILDLIARHAAAGQVV